MTRLFIAILCALGLAISPVTTSGAFAAAGAMPGCTMDGHMSGKSSHHSKMDCCTAVCQMTGAALVPPQLAEQEQLKCDGAVHDRAPAKKLASYIASGLDPPPRLPS